MVNDLERLSLRLLATMPASLGWAKRKRHSDETLKGIRRAFAVRGTAIDADLVEITWKVPHGPLSFSLKPAA